MFLTSPRGFGIIASPELPQEPLAGDDPAVEHAPDTKREAEEELVDAASGRTVVVVAQARQRRALVSGGALKGKASNATATSSRDLLRRLETVGPVGECHVSEQCEGEVVVGVWGGSRGWDF